MFSKRAILSVLLLGAVLLSACTVDGSANVNVNGTEYVADFTINEVTSTPAGNEANQSQATDTATPTVAPVSPEAPVASEASTAVPASKVYVYGYGISSKAYMEAAAACPTCVMVLVTNWNDVPSGRYYSFNAQHKDGTNMPNGHRSKDELMQMRLVIFNDFTPE